MRTSYWNDKHMNFIHLRLKSYERANLRYIFEHTVRINLTTMINTIFLCEFNQAIFSLLLKFEHKKRYGLCYLVQSWLYWPFSSSNNLEIVAITFQWRVYKSISEMNLRWRTWKSFPKADKEQNMIIKVQIKFRIKSIDKTNMP